MFQRLFGRERNANRVITEALYASIVAAARQEVFYSDWQAPDTPLGRFEVLSLHMFLFQHRMRGEQGPARVEGEARHPLRQTVGKILLHHPAFA